MAAQDPATDVQEAAAAAVAAAAAAAAVWQATRLRAVLPSIGSDVAYVGSGVASAAEDVWGWVTDTAKKAAGLEAAGISAVVAAVLPTVEAYVGQAIKAALSIINDVGNFAQTGLEAVGGLVAAEATLAFDWLINLDQGLQALLDTVTGIDSIVIPALLGEIIRLGASIEPLVLEGLANVETWAIDNIYDPLQRDLVTTAGEIYGAIQGTADWVIAEAEGLVSAETLARIAALAGLAASISTALTWIEECGAPMCDVMGPKTDLGKFLKGLQLAETAILLAELANLDGNGVENLLRGLVRVSGGVIDDIDLIFTGGETLGGAIAHALP